MAKTKAPAKHPKPISSLQTDGQLPSKRQKQDGKVQPTAFKGGPFPFPESLTREAYRLKNARPTRQSERISKGLPRRSDPMVVLPYLVVEKVIRNLPVRTAVALRRVSKLWKEQMEFCISPGWVMKHYGHLQTVRDANRDEEKWAANVFRKAAFLDHMQANGSPATIKKFTSASTWALCGERMVWIDDQSICVEHLSPWKEDERDYTLRNLAENPSGMQRNKDLQTLVDDSNRKSSEARPKRDKTNGKHEPVTVRWGLMDVLKTRRAKIRVNFATMLTDELIVIDYYQSDIAENEERTNMHTYNNVHYFSLSVSKLACINIVTGYAKWIISLDSPARRLAFPPSGSYWSRSRYNSGPNSYVVSGDKLIAFTSKARVHAISLANNTIDHGILLTIRSIQTGAILVEERCNDQYVNNIIHHRRPDHFLAHPNGETIIATSETTFYIYCASTAQLLRKVSMPIIPEYWAGFRYDLTFLPDGKTLALVDETHGSDFSCYYIDTEDEYKVVRFEKCRTAPPYARVIKTKYNPALGTQVVFTRSSNTNNEWRPEIARFQPLKDFLAGVPEELWAAEWNKRVSNASTWTWKGPVNTVNDSQAAPEALQSTRVTSLNVIQQILHSGSNLLGNMATGLNWQQQAQQQLLQLQAHHRQQQALQAAQPPQMQHVQHPYLGNINTTVNLGMLLSQQVAIQQSQNNPLPHGASFGIAGTSTADLARSARDAIIQAVPFENLVCQSRCEVTLPPSKNGGSSGRSKKRKREDAVVIDRPLQNGRRPFWMNWRLGPQRVVMGERFLVFDQEDAVYVCDFGAMW